MNYLQLDNPCTRKPS